MLRAMADRALSVSTRLSATETNDETT